MGRQGGVDPTSGSGHIRSLVWSYCSGTAERKSSPQCRQLTASLTGRESVQSEDHFLSCCPSCRKLSTGLMAGDVNGPGGKAVRMILRDRVLKHHRVGRPLGRILSLFCRENFTCPRRVLWDALSLVAAERRELVSCVEVHDVVFGLVLCPAEVPKKERLLQHLMCGYGTVFYCAFCCCHKTLVKNKLGRQRFIWF